MVISIRQALQDDYLTGNDKKREPIGGSGLKLAERSLIEKTLTQLYPCLRLHELFLWNWLNGPLIPGCLASAPEPGLRRIVEIGCGDGTLTNLLALLLPEVEIIGIDPDAQKIAKARATVGYRQNLKFVRANAAVLSEIPCDRIIYNQCLSQLGTTRAFKKMILKTSQWLVDEGDFLIRESPCHLLNQIPLMKELLPRLCQTPSLRAVINGLLVEIGYPATSMVGSQDMGGIFSPLYLRAFKDVRLAPRPLPVKIAIPQSASLGEWQALGEQSTDSLVGFLFAGAKTDFSRELV